MSLISLIAISSSASLLNWCNKISPSVLSVHILSRNWRVIDWLYKCIPRSSLQTPVSVSYLDLSDCVWRSFPTAEHERNSLNTNLGQNCGKMLKKKKKKRVYFYCTVTADLLIQTPLKTEKSFQDQHSVTSDSQLWTPSFKFLFKKEKETHPQSCVCASYCPSSSERLNRGADVMALVCEPRSNTFDPLSGAAIWLHWNTECFLNSFFFFFFLFSRHKERKSERGLMCLTTLPADSRCSFPAEALTRLQTQSHCKG